MIELKIKRILGIAVCILFGLFQLSMFFYGLDVKNGSWGACFFFLPLTAYYGVVGAKYYFDISYFTAIILMIAQGVFAGYAFSWITDD